MSAARLHQRRVGAGEPLLLVHGLGSTYAVWEPVLDLLAERFDVLAVDLPGFGASASLPPEVEPTPAALAAAVADQLAALGIDRPHVVGNSLGGWVALELARTGRARSVTAFSPAGLWRHGSPLVTTVQVRAARTIARLGRPLIRPVLSLPPTRRLAMALMSAGAPADADAAVRDALAFADAPDFERVRRSMSDRRFTGGGAIEVPVTVAFGDRDRLLLPGQNASTDQLPPQAIRVSLRGCGHVPMHDDPQRVVEVVLATVRRVTG